MKRTITVDWECTPAELAEAFCDLDDEQQAQFFIECARIALGWTAHPFGVDGQWFLVGRHLATCACSTEEARSMVKTMARACEVKP